MADVCFTQAPATDVLADPEGVAGGIWMGNLPRPPNGNNLLKRKRPISEPEPESERVNEESISRRKRLLESVVADDVVSLTQILENNRDPNWDEIVLNDKGVAQTSPLFKAVELGHDQCLATLINAHASLDIVDGHGESILHYAAAEGTVKACELLLKAGAKNVADGEGSWPLHVVDRNEKASEVTRLLLAAKAPVNITDNDGDTPLHTLAAAVKSSTRSKTNEELVATVELLLDAGADASLRRAVNNKFPYQLCFDKSLRKKLEEAAERVQGIATVSPVAHGRRSAKSPSIAGQTSTSPTPTISEAYSESLKKTQRQHVTTLDKKASVSPVLQSGLSNRSDPVQKQSKKQYHFLFHSQNSDEQRKEQLVCEGIIKALGGVVLPDEKNFDNDAKVTHLVTWGLRRSEKVVCAIAKGCYIICPQYLYECEKAGKFIEEALYPPMSGSIPSGVIWPGAANRWRQMWDRQNRGPLHGQKVLINGETKPSLEVLSRMIIAAGGKVVTSRSHGLTADVAVLGPYRKDVAMDKQGKKHPVKTTRGNVNPTWLQWVETKHVKVVDPTYFIEYITAEMLPEVDAWLLDLDA